MSLLSKIFKPRPSTQPRRYLVYIEGELVDEFASNEEAIAFANGLYDSGQCDRAEVRIQGDSDARTYAASRVPEVVIRPTPRSRPSELAERAEHVRPLGG